MESEKRQARLVGDGLESIFTSSAMFSIGSTMLYRAGCWLSAESLGLVEALCEWDATKAFLQG